MNNSNDQQIRRKLPDALRHKIFNVFLFFEISEGMDLKRTFGCDRFDLMKHLETCDEQEYKKLEREINHLNEKIEEKRAEEEAERESQKRVDAVGTWFLRISIPLMIGGAVYYIWKDVEHDERMRERAIEFEISVSDTIADDSTFYSGKTW